MPNQPTHHRVMLVAALLAVLGVLAGVQPTTATAAGTARITGRVTGPSGEAVRTIVEVLRRDGGAWVVVGLGSSTADGSYDVGGLDAGTYRVCIGKFLRTALPECWADAPDVTAAHDIALGAGEVATNRDAQLAAAAHILGTVTGPDGLGADGVVVTASQERAGEWVEVARDQTFRGGSYDLGGLRAGTYRVCFSTTGGTGVGGRECWDDAVDLATARDVTVAPGETRGGHDAVLSPASWITGTVAAPDAPDRVSWVSAEAHRFERDGRWRLVGAVRVSGDGRFAIGGLREGTYRLRFVDPGGVLAPEWSDDAETVETARSIQVAPAATVAVPHVVLGPRGPVGDPTVPAPAPTTAVPAPVQGGAGCAPAQSAVAAATAEVTSAAKKVQAASTKARKLKKAGAPKVKVAKARKKAASTKKALVTARKSLTQAHAAAVSAC